MKARAAERPKPLYRDAPDLSAWLRGMNQDTTLKAEALFLKRGTRPGQAVACMLLCPAWTFVARYAFRMGFLRGGAGLNLALLEASSTFWTYAKWWHRSWSAKGGEAGVPWPLREPEEGARR